MTLLTQPLPVRQLPARTAPAGTERRSNASLVGRRDVGDSSALFILELDSALAGYRPGQYVALGLVTDESTPQRPYSVVSLSEAGCRVELLIRRVTGGALSPCLWQLPLGARLRVGPPRGLFVLDARDQGPRLYVGAGTGAAPLLSMLEHSALQADQLPATFIHGASFADELVFGDRVTAFRQAGLVISYRPTVSRPEDPRNAGWRGRTGRAEDELEPLMTELPDARAAVAYVCGSPPMVEASAAVLARAGLPAAAIRVERF
jgi:ferredoxin-NADP reductase